MTNPAALPADWRDFLALTKPRVMSLVVFTGLCGMLAAPVMPPLALGFTAILCIALGAGAAGALNQWYESDLDALMRRTAKRPLPAGRMDRQTALHFGVGLAAFSVILMDLATNYLATALLAASILFYVFVYTVWLKPLTPHNIVIGGAAGAFPPLVGWAAATGGLTPEALYPFGIVFLWTPHHFWALSLLIKDDYARTGVPMLPVVKGEPATRRQILVYTVILVAFTLLPVVTGFLGALYLLCASVLGLAFTALAVRLLRSPSRPAALRLYLSSLAYLALLFCAMAADRVI